MNTVFLFRDEPYLKSTVATLLAHTENGGLIFDKTVFYPTGGGQPGDIGELLFADGTSFAINNTVWADKQMSAVSHLVATEDAPLRVGDEVELRLNWDIRYKRMRVHTALHLLSVILPYPVTGGSIGDGEGRLDFDIPEAMLDKESLSQELQQMVAKQAAVSTRWITDEQLDAEPELVKTLSVQPPRGSGEIRLVCIEDLDLQPCGGMHVANTGEIGNARIKKIEKKGKQNRRVRVVLDS